MEEELGIEELVQAGLMAAIGVVILVVLAGTFLGGASSIVYPASDTNLTTSENFGGPVSSVDVSATKENAIAFGGGGYVDAPSLADGSTTVCLSAELADDANADATYTLFGARNGSFLLQYDAGQWMAYAENGSEDGKATIDAPTPGEWTQVCGRYNASSGTVSVSRETTVSAPVVLGTATTSRNVSLNLRGRVDEVRTAAEAVSNATLVQYGDQPVRPWADVNRTGRLMLDEGEGTDTRVFWSSSNATIVNGSWTSGLGDPALQEGTDYELFSDPFTIRLLSSGYLDGAPIVYVTWMALPLGIDPVQIFVMAVSIALLAYVGKMVWVDFR